MDLWIYLNKSLRHFSFKFMGKDYDLLVISFVACSTRISFGVLHLESSSLRENNLESPGELKIADGAERSS